MDFTIDLTDIIRAVIMLILALISRYLIPWINAKLGTEKLTTLKIWVKAAVEAAEQIYVGTGRGTEKRQFVEKFLLDKGYRLNTQELDTLIEAAVRELIE